MSRCAPRSPSRRHLVALLWLALILPMAQAASLWHGLSHTIASAHAGDRDPYATQALHCDLCPAADAVAGGALPVAAPALRPSLAENSVPQDAVDQLWSAPVALAYLSRAPPPTPA